MTQLPWLGGRSHFSVGESLADPTALVKAAVAAGHDTVMLVDTMTVSGMPEFFTAAKKAGIKPMIGVRLRVYERFENVKKSKIKPYYLKAIILDEQGWSATLGLLSAAFDDDHFYMMARLTLPEVIAAYAPGGAVLTLGDFYGALGAGRAVEVGDACRAASVPLYAEISGVPTPLATRQARDALLLQDAGIPTLIAPPALYVDASAADSLDMMKSIIGHFGWTELSARHPYRAHVIRPESEVGEKLEVLNAALVQRYGRTEDWSIRIAAAWQSTLALPALASFVWTKQEASLPVMAPDEFLALVEQCKAGWKQRFAEPIFGHIPADLVPYQTRLKYELAMIRKLGFSAYFLLVGEITAWAKKQGIRVGPGRGSVGGSLIAYLMGITDVDPLRFGLLFERFINPERIDLPDADLDFASLRREEVLAHITARFGRDHVAGVSNYSALQAAGALKEVCRIMGLQEAPVFGKLVPKEHGQSWSLADALEEVPELASFAAKNPEVITHATHLEGKLRSFGQHAAGIIVAAVPLRERAVIERRSGGQVVNWDKRLAEEFGLVKMDVLGLSTLDMMEISTAAIFQMHGKKLDLLAIPLDDEATLDAFSRGETIGVFQLEGHGARKMLRDMGATAQISFNDIVAINALNRPGPIDAGLVDQYIKRRNGYSPVSYLHPTMEASLKETYGVLCYQEQTMKISQDLAGFSGPEADLLRKAIGKKDKDLMATMKEKFVAGAVAGYAEIELEDGRKMKIHRSAKIQVKGSSEKLTIEEIFARGLDPAL